MSQRPDITISSYNKPKTVVIQQLPTKIKYGESTPKNVYSMKSNRYVPSPRKSTEMNILTDDSITALCQRMSIKELEAFVSTSYRNLMLCNSILDDKIKYELKLKIKSIIINKLEKLMPGEYLDASNVLDQNVEDLTLFGRKIRQVDWNLIEVPNYPGLYVRKSKLADLLDILNTF